MELKQHFETRGQGHVFRYWEELDAAQRQSLLEQAGEIDLEELDRLTSTLVKGEGAHQEINYDALQPAPYRPIPDNVASDADWQDAKRIGEGALRAGKVAAFTVAGGQGTRLGYDGPKGTFPVTPVRQKPLFQVFAEKIQAARIRYGCALPWYIMTSHANHEATESFFADNGNFGLAPGSVRFFRQGRMPAVDFEGRILLDAKDSIAMSPDGHGGAIRALERSGALEEMEKQGVEAISYFQVDNPLARVIDPYFIGFHLQAGSTMSSKMVAKAYENEKLGHFCILDGKTTVIEYSDMPEALCARRDADGRLSFRAGSIAIHVIAVAFARSLAAAGSEAQLPFHRADKKIPHLDARGALAKPEKPNGVKFEMFVFDALPFASNPLVLETTRLRDFSPVKNAEGVDSPATCRADQEKLFAEWLTSVGASVPERAPGEMQLEVSPLFATDEESFAEAWSKRPRAADGQEYLYIE